MQKHFLKTMVAQRNYESLVTDDNLLTCREYNIKMKPGTKRKFKTNSVLCKNIPRATKLILNPYCKISLLHPLLLLYSKLS